MTELYDSVNHPEHYCSDPSGVECIQITRHRDFCIGNAIKYLWRAGLKHDASLTDVSKQIEDLDKAIWYINEEKKLIKEKVNEQAGERKDTETDKGGAGVC